MLSSEVTMVNVDRVFPGSSIYVADVEGTFVSLKVMALVTSEKLKNPVALAWIGGKSLPKDGDVFLSPGERHAIGKIRPLTLVSQSVQGMDSLICVIEFKTLQTTGISQQTAEAAVSRQISRAAFAGANVRVSHADPLASPLNKATKKHNRSVPNPSRKGFVTGDIVNPVVNAKGVGVSLGRAAIVRGKSGKAFARDGDGGAPVLSARGALVGFIVGRETDRTLVLPAEELGRTLGMQFLTVKDPPPYIARQPRQKRVKSILAAE
jgi:hypothetical protein